MGPTPASQPYKVYPSANFIHEVTWLNRVLALLEFDGRFLHNHCSDPQSDCWRLLGSTPATRRYEVRLCRINTQEIAYPCKSGLYNAGTLAIPELDGKSLHNYCSDPGSDCTGLLGLTPAMRRYKVRPEAPIPHRAIGYREGGAGGAEGMPGARLGVNLNLHVY